MKTVYELGLENELVLSDDNLPYLVYWVGEKTTNLHALPKSFPSFIFNFDLLTWSGKIRAGLGALGFVSRVPIDHEESIREFTTRHLGEEAFLRLIDPFVSGVYTGDPDALSMKAALKNIHKLEGKGYVGPGILLGALHNFKELQKEKRDNPPNLLWPTYKPGQSGSFRKGLQTFPNAIASVLGEERVKTSWALTKIKKADGKFLATFDTHHSATKTVRAKVLYLTTPAGATSKIASEICPSALRLADIYSPPVASVNMAYRKEWFKELSGGTPEKPLRGFGHLLPRKMGVRSLVTIWVSSLFPEQAPEGWEILLTHMGGACDPGVKDMTEEEIYAQVDADIHLILLKEGAPNGMKIGCRVWAEGIPQYCKGHLDIIEALDRDQVPGFYVGGSYKTGIGFNNCVSFGVKEAAKVAKYLKNPRTTTSGDFSA